jgi:hypothetical protein
MGTWGEEDDETDNILDWWYEILYKYSKLKYPDLIKLHKDDYEKYLDKMNSIVKKDKVKVSEFIYKNIKQSEKKYALGLIVKLIKITGGITGSGLFSKKNKSNLPKKLFKGFPEKLRKLACTCIINQRKQINSQGWVFPKKRIEALDREEKLFKCKITNTKIKKGRKSPVDSATIYSKDTVKKGLDGNKWIVSITNTGIKRWKKYKYKLYL